MPEEETASQSTPMPTNIAEGLPLSSWPQPKRLTLAYCPRCSGVMDSSDPSCPHCGYDFPLSRDTHGPGFAYSRWADYALTAGAIVAAFGSGATFLAAIGFLLNGNCGAAFIVCPFAFFLQLALMIVFIRVQRIEPP